MIRHIVLFRFNPSASAKDRAALIDALKGLKDKIELVKELEIGTDVGGKPNSYDIALNSVFETFDDVEEYAIHPDHVEVVTTVRRLCESSVKVDFEF